MKRSFTYGKKLCPDATDEELYNRAFYHLNRKFGENGYAKFYFEDEEYEKFLKEIKSILTDRKQFCNIQKEYINKLKASGEIT